MSTQPSISQPQLLGAASDMPASFIEDQMKVAALDLALQAAVKDHDAETIDAILHQQFAMVLGDGKIVTREQLLETARMKLVEFEIQDEDAGTQTVRVWGDTAVVTARLHIRGRRGDEHIDRRVWFSDTYIRTPGGWRYAFAQVSLPLPDGAIA
jgi:hypothetical protein